MKIGMRFILCNLNSLVANFQGIKMLFVLPITFAEEFL